MERKWVHGAKKKNRKINIGGSTGEAATRTGCHMSRGLSTVYSCSTTNDFRYTHRSTDYRRITRSTDGRGCHVSLCWGALPCLLLALVWVKHAVCSMVSRQEHTRSSARTTHHSYRKCIFFFFINMSINGCYILDRVMRVRLNLPTALALHFELFAVVLVATSCCYMCYKFHPSATATTPAVVCLQMSSIGVRARRTYCCSHRVRTGLLVPQPYDDELKRERRWHEMAWTMAT